MSFAAAVTPRSPSLVTLAVFQKDGESHVFENVNPETISSWKDGKERFIRFAAFSHREVVIPDVAYWTEEA